MTRNGRVVNLLRRLIGIDSQNPCGTEYTIARFVKKYLDDLGVRTRVCEYKPRRTNVIGFLDGVSNEKALLISPHLDTVPAGSSWSMDPFKGIVRGGKLYGLGATDCKCNLACALEAMRGIVAGGARLGYRLIFAATADEESGSGAGILPLLENKILRPDAAVVLDSDDFSIITAQKGLMHLRVMIKGKKAHGAYPWRGKNAIDAAVNILNVLKSRKFIYAPNRYLRPPTVNIGTIRGGDKVNIVADWCEFELDYRFLPGMPHAAILRELRDIIRTYARVFSIEVRGLQQPYIIAEDHPLVLHLCGAMKRCRVRPRVSGSEGATVITFFQRFNIPAVATGFGSGNCAHTADEYVKIANLHKGVRVLEDFLRNFRFERASK